MKDVLVAAPPALESLVTQIDVQQHEVNQTIYSQGQAIYSQGQVSRFDTAMHRIEGELPCDCTKQVLS
jgi:hypothetical protein